MRSDGSHPGLLWSKARRLEIGLLAAAVLVSCDSGARSDGAALDVSAATAAATALADAVDDFATRLASQLPAEADNAEALEFARQIASERTEATRMRRVADLYADLAAKTRGTGGDGAKAAYGVTESIAIVAPALAVDAPDSQDGKTSQETLSGLVETLAKQIPVLDRPTEGGRRLPKVEGRAEA